MPQMGRTARADGSTTYPIAGTLPTEACCAGSAVDSAKRVKQKDGNRMEAF
jgi:hypothetical protein